MYQVETTSSILQKMAYSSISYLQTNISESKFKQTIGPSFLHRSYLGFFPGEGGTPEKIIREALRLSPNPKLLVLFHIPILTEEVTFSWNCDIKMVPLSHTYKRDTAFSNIRIDQYSFNRKNLIAASKYEKRNNRSPYSFSRKRRFISRA